MNARRLSLLGLLAATLFCSNAQADVITTLFSTGYDAGGNLAAPGAADAHWSLTANADGSGSTAYVTVPGGFPLPDAWVPNPPTAQWIQPTSGTASTNAVGQYIYQTQFDLTGFVPSTSSLTFTAAADNQITNVLLNGNDVGFFWAGPTGVEFGYASFSPSFSINNPAFFQNGINTLQFVVQNDPPPSDPTNPTGLIVNITGQSNPVPEPSTMILVGLIGAGAYAARRFRRKSAPNAIAS